MVDKLLGLVPKFRSALDVYLEVEEDNVYDRGVVVGMICQNQDPQIDVAEILTVLYQSKLKEDF